MISSRRTSGFSLVEVAMVLAIIAIIAAIAAPRYAEGVALRRVEAAGRRVRADLEYARELARTKRASVTVSFDPVQHTYEIGGAPGVVRSESIVHLSQEPYLAEILLLSLGPDDAIIFNGFGIPDDGGKVQVGRGAVFVDIDITGATGEVTGP